ncbi:hypothetical protein N7457_001301 [Penicillium paradoxum]|uniref:uncharacterized protein n=1 Tax=Penicillium paradoxum TaxID=176176 RepID=UPI002546F034|nr:uncharacterized protein N7457_001301 [Penicillium paradoxum]KAJ5794702.1 hypothetical protein N7457_001301 [Penicillium paradoxum]
MKNPLHNPLPASLSSECEKAAAILESFINPKLKIDGKIPRKIFLGAKGIAVFTALRLGFLGSVRFGSGLIVARLPDGSWSAPSAMAMGGLGAGGQFGAELTDFVFVLTTDAAVKTFMQSGNLTIGGNISMAVGPIGRSAEAGGVVGAKNATGVFAYSKTRGLYGGLTVEGGVLAERPYANKKMYGRKVPAKELLSGQVPSPPEAQVLIDVLNGECFRAESSAEPTSESPDESQGQVPEAAVQPASEQPQGVSVPVAAQVVAAEPGVGKVHGTTELLTGDSHGLSHEPQARETEPVVEHRSPTQHGARGHVELPNSDTQDAQIADVPHAISTTEDDLAAGSSTQPAHEAIEPVAGETDKTIRGVQT